LALLALTQALKLGFSAQDYVQMHQHGLAVDNKSQLELFKKFPIKWQLQPLVMAY
jgi:hypothetical protein